ncbi:MAG: type II secretion system minor pseudopilin GspI [Thiotrichales bacterium]
MHQRGFSLLEVILALAVLALALAAIIQTTSSMTRNTAYLQDKTFAHWVAQNRLAELRLGGAWPEPGSTEGSERLADRPWRWEITVSNTPEPELRRVDVRVRGENDPAETSIALLTGFLRDPSKLAPIPPGGDDTPPPPAEPPPPTETPTASEPPAPTDTPPEATQ